MSYFTDFVLPRKFSNDSERRAQVSISFSLQLTIAGFTLFIKKKSRFVEVVLFYPKNEVIGFPKIEINEFVSAMFMFKLSLTR